METNALLAALARVRTEGRVALCGYFLAGYPTPRQFYEMVRAAGLLDVIEFGIPAADPALDGPVISNAHRLVIDHRGMDAETSLALLGGLRSIPQPRFVMTYARDGRGLDGFLRKCVENNVHGVFAPDIGREEAAYVATIARALHLLYVGFIDAQGDPEDLFRTADISDLVYLRASRGATGQSADMDAWSVGQLADAIGRIRSRKPSIAIAAGIGIQDPDQVRQLARLDLDMVIVGTRLLEQLSLGSGRMAEYIASLRRVTDREVLDGPVAWPVPGQV